MIEAELHDGRILEFPDGTDPAVVQATVKKVLGVTSAPKSGGIGSEVGKGLLRGAGEIGKGISRIPSAVLDPFGRAGGTEPGLCVNAAVAT